MEKAFAKFFFLSMVAAAFFLSPMISGAKKQKEEATASTRSLKKILPSLNSTMNCTECPNVYFPVCTTTNITFINICQMNCVQEGHQMARRGICIEF
ncbi:uncharacterized protein LOC123710977 isoform X4 [Pieris brassicae]|uniref:uncharacterized protein LOC123710977 isoform X4 n=1 Tax=Pieris brassicae TaxID=7116 RepID=UPI001E662361|nr:uncharacterized protein LOC123710977 isoform X4 [Pieris brassicae]